MFSIRRTAVQVLALALAAVALREAREGDGHEVKWYRGQTDITFPQRCTRSFLALSSK